jgi:hypothetical protein
MPVPWLVVGQLVLSNLDKIIGVVKPGFTRKKGDAPVQSELVSQQITELQAAASNNAEQIAALAIQVKELVASLAAAAEEVARQRAATRRVATVAAAIAVVALAVAAIALFAR